MKKLLLLAAIATLALAAVAAEQPKEPEKKDGQEQPKDGDKKKAKKPVIFKPTEELSEDFSVPFPTDI
ncbi:hypothetical protein ACVBEJ_11510 [Porticoccus sp. GXU_MW_L64]